MEVIRPCGSHLGETMRKSFVHVEVIWGKPCGSHLSMWKSFCPCGSHFLSMWKSFWGSMWKSFGCPCGSLLSMWKSLGGDHVEVKCPCGSHLAETMWFLICCSSRSSASSTSSTSSTSSSTCSLRFPFPFDFSSNLIPILNFTSHFNFFVVIQE